MNNTNILIKAIQANPDRNWDFNRLMKNIDLDLTFYITFREHFHGDIVSYILSFKKDLDVNFFNEFSDLFSVFIEEDQIILASESIFEIMLIYPNIDWDYYAIFKDKLHMGKVTQKNIRDFCHKDLPWTLFDKNIVVDLDDSLVADFPDKGWNLRNKELTHNISFNTVTKCTNFSYYHYENMSSHPGLDINFIKENKSDHPYINWDYKELWKRGYFEIYYENLTPDYIEYYNYISNIIRKYVVDWLYRPDNPGFKRLFERNKTFYQKSDN